MADGITFQDSTLATPASGTEVATDDAGAAGHVQIVKLAIGTDGSATVIPADATNGLLVELSNPGDIVGGGVDRVTGSATSSGLTTATTLYTALDQMGDLEELTGMAAASAGGGYISSARLLCDAPGVIGGVRVWVFSGSVTLASDNAAFSLSDADALKVEGFIDFGTPQSATNNAFVQVLNVNLDYTCDATSLFIAFQTLSTHTAHFAAVDDLHLELIAYRQ